LKTDVLVIGGSAAGIVAGVTARKHYPDKDITLVRKEEKVLIPCGIPYTMETVDGPEENLIPDGAVTGKDINLIIDEVVDIDRENKKVELDNGEDIFYEKLLLATGSIPIVPPIKGADLSGVYSVKKDFDMLKELKSKIEDAKNLVIIGGGFIGIEFADECRKKTDMNVTIVEMMDNILALVCDYDFCCKAEESLKSNGVEIFKDSRVVEILGEDEVSGVKLANGTELTADVVILATGAKANVSLAEKAGLDFDKRKGILVDNFMRTSDSDIFACGDCAEKPSFFGNNFAAARLASIAGTEGRVAGANLFELRREKKGSVGIFSTIIDDLAFGVAGLTKKQAESADIPVVTGSAVSVNRHPGKMPGAAELGIVLVFRKYDCILIGAQAYGDHSVGEFINILGLAIEKKMTAEDLAIMQVGTQPALTASPVAYQIVNAAEDAVSKLR